MTKQYINKAEGIVYISSATDTSCDKAAERYFAKKGITDYHSL